MIKKYMSVTRLQKLAVCRPKNKNSKAQHYSRLQIPQELSTGCLNCLEFFKDSMYLKTKNENLLEYFWPRRFIVHVSFFFYLIHRQFSSLLIHVIAYYSHQNHMSCYSDQPEKVLKNWCPSQHKPALTPYTVNAPYDYSSNHVAMVMHCSRFTS